MPASLRTTTAISSLRVKRDLHQLKATLRVKTKDVDHLDRVAAVANLHHQSKHDPASEFNNNAVEFDLITAFHKNDRDNNNLLSKKEWKRLFKKLVKHTKKATAQKEKKDLYTWALERTNTNQAWKNTPNAKSIVTAIYQHNIVPFVDATIKHVFQDLDDPNYVICFDLFDQIDIDASGDVNLMELQVGFDEIVATQLGEHLIQMKTAIEEHTLEVCQMFASKQYQTTVVKEDQIREEHQAKNPDAAQLNSAEVRTIRIQKEALDKNRGCGCGAEDSCNLQ